MKKDTKAIAIRTEDPTHPFDMPQNDVDERLKASWKKNRRELEEFMSSDRFKYNSRPYTASQVAPLRNSFPFTYPSTAMASKLYDMLRDSFDRREFIHTWGAIDPVQVINLSKHLKTVYVSGWQCSTMASSSNEPGPDFADYPANTVPNKVHQLYKAQLYHDVRQSEERSRMSEQARRENPAHDFMAPMIADADTGFGGSSSVMKLTKMFIESGAAGIHMEDQRVGAKKCGHMSGKVLVSTREFINKLISIRLQADICGSPLVIVGRTDSLSAKLIDSNIDPVDQPYILGIWNSSMPDDLKTYPEAGEQLIGQFFSHDQDLMNQKLRAWRSIIYECSLVQAKKLAEKLGFALYFDWDTPRTCEGFYPLKGQDVNFTINRVQQYAKYCDLVWVETDTPDLKVAEQLATGIHKTNPQTMLAYNLSPSFNWDSFKMGDEQIKNFSRDLGRMGWVFHFITLAGFHMNSLVSEVFSRLYAKDSMLAYVEYIQRKEKREGVDQLKHQKWSGSELADRLMTLGTFEVSTISSGSESTEHQFDPVAMLEKQKNLSSN